MSELKMVKSIPQSAPRRKHAGLRSRLAQAAATMKPNSEGCEMVFTKNAAVSASVVAGVLNAHYGTDRVYRTHTAGGKLYFYRVK